MESSNCEVKQLRISARKKSKMNRNTARHISNSPIERIMPLAVLFHMDNSNIYKRRLCADNIS